MSWNANVCQTIFALLILLQTLHSDNQDHFFSLQWDENQSQKLLQKQQQRSQREAQGCFLTGNLIEERNFLNILISKTKVQSLLSLFRNKEECVGWYQARPEGAHSLERKKYSNTAYSLPTGCSNKTFLLLCVMCKVKWRQLELIYCTGCGHMSSGWLVQKFLLSVGIGGTFLMGGVTPGLYF